MLEMKYLVSVIVPVYKVEKYIYQCVDSIISQTYSNLEIILIDDGSPDRCPAICDEYVKKDNRIKVVHKQNGGLSSARNAGIDFASGDFITFVDSDDYLADNYVEKMYLALINNNVDMCFCKKNLVYEKDKDKIEIIASKEKCLKNNENFIVDYNYFLNHIFCNNKPEDIIMCSAWRILYKKNVFNNNFRFNENIKFIEDRPFMLGCLSKINKYCVVDEYLYFYRQTPNSLIRSYINNLIESNLVSYNDTISFIKDKKLQSFVGYVFIKELFNNEIIFAKSYNKDTIRQIKKLSIYKNYNLSNLFRVQCDKKSSYVFYFAIKLGLGKILFKLYQSRKKNE